MREIKFRAWDKEIKKMVNPFGNSNGDITFLNFLIEDIQNNFNGRLKLMQFTGLKDKNGKEIYEGDIVRNLHFNSMAQVVWKDCEPAKHSDKYEDLEGFISNLGEFEFVGISGRTKAFYINEFEVIGNIYENPELLERSSTITN